MSKGSTYNPSPHETELVPDLKNAAAFRAIWHRQQPHVYFLALQLLGDRQAAQDAATDAFVKLWKSDQQFPTERAIAGWLRVTTRNGCLDILRQRQSEQYRIQLLENLQPAMDETWTREDIMADRLQALYKEIEALSPRGREIFKMRFMKGIKNEMIAEQLGLSHQSVRDHLSKSLKALRLSLKHRQDLLLLLIILWPHPPMD